MLDLHNYSAYGLLKQYNEHQMSKTENECGDIQENYGYELQKPRSSMMFINVMFVLLMIVFFGNLFLLIGNWQFLESWAQVLALLLFLSTDLRGMIMSIFIIMVGRRCEFR